MRKLPGLPLPALSVRQLLTLLVLLTALPLLALALFMSSALIETERHVSRGDLMNSARTLASLVDNEINSHLAVATTLATAPALLAGDLATFKQQAIQTLAVLPGAWINVSDPTGQIVMSTLVADGVALPRRNSIDFMRRTWETRHPQVSDVVMGQFTKRYNAIVEVPVFKDDMPLYSVIIGLNPDRFLALLRHDFSPESVVGIVDRNSNFVARIPDHDKRVGTPASEGWRAAMARSAEGFADVTTLEGEESLIPYVKTKNGWTVGIARLKRVTEAPTRRLIWTLGLSGGALTLASLALGLGLARRLAMGMDSLLEASRMIADEKIVTARALPVHEATQISHALSATSQTLAARTADLSRAHDTFYNLVQNSPFGVYLVDSEFRIAQISNGAANTFVNTNPVLGRDLAEVLTSLWPEPFATEAISRFRHTLATGEPYHQSSLEETRLDTGIDEAYDWQIERVILPDGSWGVVCYYYDFTALKQAQNAVREGGLFTSTVLEASPDCLKIGGFDGRVQFINHNGACLLEADHSDAIVGLQWETLWPPDQQHVIRNAIDEAQAGRASRFTAEAPTGKGTQKFWDVTVAPIMGTNGKPVKFFAASRDITGRKQAETHQAFLLNELAHRMKNQLAVIQAISGQTARNAGSLKQFQDDFSQRLQGLAVATDVLVSQGWQGAPLAELVRRQLASFVPDAARFDCNGPNVTISADATQTIGLALHELATNAVKYGAWYGAAGRVTVTWHLVSDSVLGNSLCLRWLESEGPRVAAPKSRGFGHVVIETMAAQRIGGSAELVFAPEGVSWVLTIPQNHFDSRQRRKTSS